MHLRGKWRQFKDDHYLKLRIISLSLSMLIFTSMPFVVILLVKDLTALGNTIWVSMEYKITKVENLINKTSSPLFNNSSSFFDGLLYPGDNIILQGRNMVTYTEPEPEGHEHSIGEPINHCIVELFMWYEKEKIEQFNKENHGKIYSRDNHFHFSIEKKINHPISGETITIVYDKNIQSYIDKILNKFYQTYFYAFLVFIILSAIVTFISFRMVFHHITQAIHLNFNQVKESHYQEKMDTDVKYGKEIQVMLLKLNEVLDTMQKKSQENLQTMQDVSHEINTHLTSVQQSVDMILRYGKEDPQLTMSRATLINESIKRATQIMRSILELSRLKMDMTSFKYANRFNVKDLIDDIVRYKMQIQSRFQFEMTMSTDYAYLYMAKEHFYTALRPILENAMKYSYEVSHTVYIDVMKKNQEIRITVSNFGPPIDQEDIPYLFDRNYRGQHNRKQGSGLGLHIASEVMKLYGGTIEVVCVNHQTNFTLVFPISS